MDDDTQDGLDTRDSDFSRIVSAITALRKGKDSESVKTFYPNSDDLFHGKGLKQSGSLQKMRSDSPKINEYAIKCPASSLLTFARHSIKIFFASRNTV
jgi:hypothetical protein